MDNLNEVDKKLINALFDARLCASNLLQTKSSQWSKLYDVRQYIRLYRYYHIEKDSKIINALIENNVPLEQYVNKRVCPSKMVIVDGFNKDEFIESIDKKMDDLRIEKQKLREKEATLRQLLEETCVEHKIIWHDLY